MSFYVIDIGNEREERCKIAKTAKVNTTKAQNSTMLDITVDKVRIHLDSFDTGKIKRLLEENL